MYPPLLSTKFRIQKEHGILRNFTEFRGIQQVGIPRNYTEFRGIEITSVYNSVFREMPISPFRKHPTSYHVCLEFVENCLSNGSLHIFNYFQKELFFNKLVCSSFLSYCRWVSRYSNVILRACWSHATITQEIFPPCYMLMVGESVELYKDIG
jgi:hypothetical protein